MKPQRNPIRARLGTGLVASLLSISLHAQPSGQWDFDKGDLSATVGTTIQYLDGAGAATSQQAKFGTTASFGIPDIGGTAALVMRFPAASPGMGFTIPAPKAANGGGSFVNQWTLLLDILFPPESDGKVRAIIDTDGGLFNPDSDLFVGANGGLGVGGQFSGKLLPNIWYRIGFVVDASAKTISKYINGVQVGVQAADSVDGRWALAPGGNAGLFADDNDQTAIGYVNSIQLRDVALSKAQMLALGGPVAAGLPRDLPPVPSYIEQAIPLTAFAPKGSDIGFVLNLGDTTVQDSSISLKLDGTAVASPTISRNGKLVTVRKAGIDFSVPSRHTIELSYTDSLKGQQTASHQFDIVIFYEDFDSLKLEDSVDELAGTPAVWTRTPPTGWKIDDSKMPGKDDPDVGRTEWEGWSFANREFWIRADDQTRSLFTLARNTVAIADPDEWDDRGSPVRTVGYFNSFLNTPPIPITGASANSIFVRFDSSWRPEGMDDAGPDGQQTNNQTGTVSVSYDGGPPIEIFKYDSDPKSPTYKPDAQNETVIVDAKNPAGAKQMVLTFGMTNAGNDWWWAFDNLIVNVGVKPPKITQEPKALEITAGQSATFTVVAEGDSLAYQWFKASATGKAAISGATKAQFTIPAVTLADAGSYSAEVSNPGGKATSAAVDLNVLLDLAGTTLFAENFDTLVLGTNVNEALFGAKVWTKKPPVGWTVDDTMMAGIDDPASGVIEWKGWSFADAKWWAATAGDQRRSEFTKASGAAAIADPDEWDDRAPASSLGTFNSFLKTPPISLAGIKPNSAVLRLNSSWRPEGNQTATITVSYDSGAPIDVLVYKETTDDKTNETLDLKLNNPANAKTMVIAFGLTEAGNNWFWAIDNIVVKAERPPLFSENFDGLTLGANVEEGITTGSGGAKPNVWTKTPPTGWIVNDSGVPGAGTANDGVKEWAGWSFADRAWWASTAGDQQRSQFTKGLGAVAIADGDERDDLPRAAGTMNAFLSTRPIDVTGQAANTLILQFDSSWRDEPDQKANVRVSYDGGAAVEVLRWESVETSPNFHNDAVNETVNVPLRNPAGAKSMVITFGYLDAGNNWWWAIDNLSVFAGETPPPAVAPTIATQPQGTTVTAGASVTLTVAANGTAPLAYQWKKNGQSIAGATQQTLTLSNAQASDSGSYTVDVSNSAGTVTSQAVVVTVNAPAAPPKITDGLAVYLKFDGDLNDASGNKINGTAVGSPTFAAGKIGSGALSVTSKKDGSAFSYVTLGTPDLLKFGTNTDFTVSFWANFKTWTGDPSFVANKDWNSGGNTGFVIATHDDGHLQWNYRVTGGAARKDYDGPAGAFTGGGWHHVAVSFARNGDAKTYLDGKLVNTSAIGPSTGTIESGLPINIGQDGTGKYTDSGAVGVDGGLIDEVAIWRRVLDGTEVQKVFVRGSAGANFDSPAITDDLAVHLTFDADLKDSSGNNLHGTAVGSVSVGPGKIGTGALVVNSKKDGSSFNYVTLGTPELLKFGTNTDFSVSVWANFKTWTGDPAFVANKDWNSGGNTGFVIATHDDGHLQWNYRVTGGAARKDYDGPAGAFTGGGWHHVVVSFARNGDAKTYLDGKLVNTTAIGPSTGTIEPGLPINIGQDGTGKYTDSGAVGVENGLIDDVAIWRRILTEAEVQNIFTAGGNGTSFDGTGGGLRLGATRTATGLSLSWSGIAVLEASDSVNGPWLPVVNAVSPFSIQLSGSAKFYRLKQ
ncbi:MAG: immunoglobulin domain-containing protein [Verrucomicrobia bacterium]|nr:immunoglobulin domain-containing protein [Verrucomicrobiota bacterium]